MQLRLSPISRESYPFYAPYVDESVNSLDKMGDCVWHKVREFAEKVTSIFPFFTHLAFGSSRIHTHLAPILELIYHFGVCVTTAPP